jgi:hypothetical protein
MEDFNYEEEVKKRIELLDETGIILFGECVTLEIPLNLRCPKDHLHSIEADDIKYHIKCDECASRYHYSDCTSSSLMKRFYIYESITNIINTRNMVVNKFLHSKKRDYVAALKIAVDKQNDRMVERITGRIECINIILENLQL